MDIKTNSHIPDNECEYWNMGIDNGVAVTTATATYVWQEYIEFYKHSKWLNALVAINRLLAYEKKQPELWRIKAKLHGFMGHSICCNYAISTLLEFLPDDLDAMRMQAIFHFCHHSNENAIAICDSVLAKHPLHADFWALKADILCSQGDIQGADKACEKALEINPDCAAALRLRTNIQPSL